MAIDAKMSFLRQIEQGSAETIPQATMQRMMIIISDVLEGFDIREHEHWEAEEQDDLFEAFLATMKVQGRSKGTIARYERMIKIFMAFAKTTTRKINVYHVRAWLAAEKNRGIQDSTLDGNRQVLSSYFGWLFREGLIERNPMSNVGTIKVPKKKKPTYSPVDMTKIMDACRKLRDKAMIQFMATTGCRVSEMTGLNREQLDLRNQEVIVHGKGDKERVVYFDSVTAMLLEEYLATRTDDNPALFVGQRGERLQPNGVRAMLKDIQRRTGVAGIHPHKFRRTLATDMARHGTPIQTVAHLLGHEKIDTTMEYVQQSAQDIKYDYRRLYA